MKKTPLTYFSKLSKKLNLKRLDHILYNTCTVLRYKLGGSGGGGGGVPGVVLVRVCEPVFQNLPHSYT